jgi:hypothetical protein
MMYPVNRRTLRLLTLTIAVFAMPAAFPAAIAATAAGPAPVVELAPGGAELPATQRRAVERAIVAAADAAGVAVCREGAALTLPASAPLDQACSAPGLPLLWWDAEIRTEKSGDADVLDVTLQLAMGGPTAESPQVIVPPHALLPAGRAEIPGEERDVAILDGVYRSLLAADGLHAWLAGLKKRPELSRAQATSRGPAKSGMSVTPTPPADGAAPVPRKTHSAGRLRAWEKELVQITDLLIDGHYLEGRDRATRLLKEDPPPEIAGRARELLAKAETKITQAGTSPERSSSGPIVIRPSQGTGTLSGVPPRRRWERSFEVRMARDDRGFADGLDGRLVVSEDGVVFTRQGESRPDWAITWADLTAAHRADGIWDVPYPLALAEKGGRLHHLVVIDPAGKPLPGGPVLSALAEGRLASHKGYS